MGQIAEDSVNGIQCSHCGCIFKKNEGEAYEHGYPVLCWECYDKETTVERDGIPRALVETF